MKTNIRVYSKAIKIFLSLAMGMFIMRFFLFFLILLYLSSVSFAESFSQYNSASRTAIVLYVPDSKGFYHRQSNVDLNEVNNIEVQYAFDKKNRKLYVANAYGNFVVQLTETKAKWVKKDKSIPHATEKDIEALVLSVNNSLDKKFAQYNLQREKHITDSINYAREQERLVAIERARRDSLAKAQRIAEIEQYKSSHNWHWIPIIPDNNYCKYSNSIDLECDLCDERKHVYIQDSIWVFGIHNDTIYSPILIEGYLNKTYYHIHRYNIPPNLKASSGYKQHFQIFKDSLTSDTLYDNDFIKFYNSSKYLDYLKDVQTQAPYGFFVDWGWNSEYSAISFHFDYLNTNKRTIKYIDVYWKVTNSVNDIRKTGHFKGTGPLEQFESARWNWDYSSYYVAGDASNMQITKVIITYMNGQHQVLTGKQIMFD